MCVSQLEHGSYYYSVIEDNKRISDDWNLLQNLFFSILIIALIIIWIDGLAEVQEDNDPSFNDISIPNVSTQIEDATAINLSSANTNSNIPDVESIQEVTVSNEFTSDVLSVPKPKSNALDCSIKEINMCELPISPKNSKTLVKSKVVGQIDSPTRAPRVRITTATKSNVQKVKNIPPPASKIVEQSPGRSSKDLRETPKAWSKCSVHNETESVTPTPKVKSLLRKTNDKEKCQDMVTPPKPRRSLRFCLNNIESTSSAPNLDEGKSATTVRRSLRLNPSKAQIDGKNPVEITSSELLYCKEWCNRHDRDQAARSTKKRRTLPRRKKPNH